MVLAYTPEITMYDINPVQVLKTSWDLIELNSFLLISYEEEDQYKETHTIVKGWKELIFRKVTVFFQDVKIIHDIIILCKWQNHRDSWAYVHIYTQKR